MKFKPCIDIHNGQVKQIVGQSLVDNGDYAKDNFVADKNADFFAKLYKDNKLYGGHVIMLNAKDSEYYLATKNQAKLALSAFSNGLQVGGGIDDTNALEFIQAGAAKIIITSFVFKDGRINYDNLEKLSKLLTPDRIVLDLSCRKKDGKYYIVTDRWQKFTDVELDKSIFDKLHKYCNEFLIHAVDVEGKAAGIETQVVTLLGEVAQSYNKEIVANTDACSSINTDIVNNLGVIITYAGGISSMEDIELIRRLGKGYVDYTVGSALDLFGGSIKFEDLINNL